MNLALTTSSLTGFTVNIDTDALAKKRDAIELAQAIVRVTNPTEQQDAIAAASLLKGLIKGMETTRVEVKKPVLEAGRRIDDVAKGYTDTLALECKRVERLAGDYQAERNRKTEELRREELRQMELERQKDASLEAERARAERTVEIMQKPTITGASVRVSMDYEILDDRALFAARPDLFDLVPRRSAILATINIPDAPNFPGLRTFQTTKVQAKAA